MTDRRYATTGRSGRTLHAVSSDAWFRSVCGVRLDGPNRVESDRIPPGRTFCERCGRAIAARTDTEPDMGPFGDAGAAPI